MTPPLVTFSSNLTVGGSTTPSLNSNARAALVSATADTMGIPVDTVTYVRDIVLSVQNQRRLRETSLINLFSTTYTILSTTVVTLPLATTTYETADELYISLTTMLDTAVASGDFTNTLDQAAIINNATELTNAVVTEVSNSPISVDNDLQFPPTDENNNLKAKQIAGIIIGGLVVISLLLGGFYYLICVRQDIEKEVFAENAGVEIVL